MTNIDNSFAERTLKYYLSPICNVDCGESCYSQCILINFHNKQLKESQWHFIDYRYRLHMTFRLSSFKYVQVIFFLLPTPRFSNFPQIQMLSAYSLCLQSFLIFPTFPLWDTHTTARQNSAVLVTKHCRTCLDYSSALWAHQQLSSGRWETPEQISRRCL